ncbi:enediyne biosynthesis protein [Microbispora siamensis]|uniref:Enediyne biosynthesis protein n=2 Tax=Streptosporangiaceae TaxID=2004 RepID=A0ABQ4GYR9_9ACTN|nr:enediyne biosynthesis protein [Microbispora siamensis]
MTPDISETKMSTRGFHVKSPESRDLLETVGETFLLGYAHAMEARTVAEAEERLEEVPTRFRGFAYEGAGMALAILDAMPFGGGRIEKFLAGRGDRHIYMVYVGIGWAMARLPRFLWPKAETLDPLLRWLVLDGYGFHQAYFRTDQYVYGQYRDPEFPWPADATRPYANRALDQGIGRAMWFVAGTDADRCASLIESFDPSRWADLFAGAGLAATYAGGAAEEELRRLWERAGEHRSQVAQGSAFAAEARVRAGLVVPHTRLATEIFCGTTEERAALVTQRVRPAQPSSDGNPPAYELWRQCIANEFVSLGGVTQ